MPAPNHTDEIKLIAECKTGSLQHQEMLYRRFYGFAMGIGLRYSLNRDDALEVVNDAFIKAFKSILRYDEVQPFKPWLATIIINTAIDRRRKELKYQLNTDIEGAVLMYHASDTIGDLSAKEILNLLKLLPAIQATIFNLFEIDGYSHEEISKMLNIPASSSRVYLTRGKEKLRKLLKIMSYDERRSVR